MSFPQTFYRTMGRLFSLNIPLPPPPPPPTLPPPRLHTCHVFKVNKRAPSCHCVAVGQVYFSAFCFSVFRVVSGCQTRYSSCRLLKVGTLIGCDSVSLSSKNRRRDGAARVILFVHPCSLMSSEEGKEKKKKLNLSTSALAWMFCAHCAVLDTPAVQSAGVKGRRSLDSRGSAERGGVVCVNSAATCSDR